MTFLEEAIVWIRQEPELALAVAAGLYALLLLLVLWAILRQAFIKRRLARVLRGVDGANLEEMLLEHRALVEDVATQVADTAAQGSANADLLRHCLQKVGMVRYDAFADIGGGQSFSVALLDGESNGVVLSGLYSRNNLRVYAKPVVAGASPLVLTEEEQDAISRARAGGAETGITEHSVARR